MKRDFIPSVNFHLWEPCNMRCQFCFATFQDVKKSILPLGHLPKEQAIQVVIELAKSGFRKITFAGGEPTLCPWLPELIKVAKQAGMTTMIVTNGSRLNDPFLEQNRNFLDWIAISIDSLNPKTNFSIGRAIGGKTPLTAEFYKSVVKRVKHYGYGLKINTVINRRNVDEDMNEFIQFARPKRWKILQALPIAGQNDDSTGDFEISESDFIDFVERHENLSEITDVVSESNEQMKGSYAMVDPAGRFFDNAQGCHHYSKPILEVGVENALMDVNYDFNKFSSRGGLYDWELIRNPFPLKLTISGEVASGKSTIGKLLAEELNYDFVSIGNKTREIAATRGMSIVEFQKECLHNPELDLQIDRQFSTECNSREGLVIDYRLGFKFISSAYHIFLKVTENVAIERLRNANRINETFHTINLRNESFKKQFQNNYSVDYTDRNNYDLVINIDENLSSESITHLIIKHLMYNHKL
jgi:radical S-adenosyl methionine domain-containing protein 2